MKKLNVLIGCEYTGAVREEFRKLGHNAWSCDLLPSEIPRNHYQGDLLDFIKSRQWDLLIAHPPCTYLANSGARWLYHEDGSKNQDRWEAFSGAATFFFQLLNCGIPHICIENPVIHKYGMELIGRKYDQIINPHQFGHPESKATCLWLKGLPKLQPTKIMPKSYSCQCGSNFPLELGEDGCPNCKGKNKVVIGYGHKQIIKSGKVLPVWYSNNKKLRNRTFSGIAKAMASQWSSYLLSLENKSEV